jgi:hypothetical protein
MPSSIRTKYTVLYLPYEPLFHDVDALEVGLRHEHGDVADGVAEPGLQLDQTVELESNAPLSHIRGVWREGDVDLIRLAAVTLQQTSGSPVGSCAGTRFHAP